MPLQFFPPEQENTIRLVAGQRTYRVMTPERTMVVNGKTFGVDGDNRFEPLARVVLLAERTSASAQTAGGIPDCSPYWANDVISRYTIVIASVRLNTFQIPAGGAPPFPVVAVMPQFSEFQIRQSFGGVPTVRSTLSVGAAKPLVGGDVQGLLVADAGIGMNEVEIWGRIPDVNANPAQTNATPFSIVFGIAIEAWPASPNEEILGKFVTAIP